MSDYFSFQAKREQPKNAAPRERLPELPRNYVPSIDPREPEIEVTETSLTDTFIGRLHKFWKGV